MIQYVRTDFINGRPDGCQTFSLCLIQWRFNASKASDCVWCARGRFAILQISITNYTPLCIFAFLLKIIRISPNHNKNQSICFNWCTYANAKVSIIRGSTTFSMLLSEIRWNKFSAPDKKITLLAGLSCVMSCQCAKNPNGCFSLQLLLIVGVGDVWRQGQLCKRNGDDYEDYLVMPTWQSPNDFILLQLLNATNVFDSYWWHWQWCWW